MTFSHFYFWSGSANNNNVIPEGNYNGIRISNTTLTTGENGTHGIDWQRGENSPYKGRVYQKINLSGWQSDVEFTLGSEDCDTLVIRYFGTDFKQEQIIKKQPGNTFVLKSVGQSGLAQILIVYKAVETTIEKIEKGFNPLNLGKK